MKEAGNKKEKEKEEKEAGNKKRRGEERTREGVEEDGGRGKARGGGGESEHEGRYDQKHVIGAIMVTVTAFKICISHRKTGS